MSNRRHLNDQLSSTKLVGPTMASIRAVVRETARRIEESTTRERTQRERENNKEGNGIRLNWLRVKVTRNSSKETFRKREREKRNRHTCSHTQLTSGF